MVSLLRQGKDVQFIGISRGFSKLGFGRDRIPVGGSDQLSQKTYWSEKELETISLSCFCSTKFQPSHPKPRTSNLCNLTPKHRNCKLVKVDETQVQNLSMHRLSNRDLQAGLSTCPCCPGRTRARRAQVLRELRATSLDKPSFPDHPHDLDLISYLPNLVRTLA